MINQRLPESNPVTPFYAHCLGNDPNKYLDSPFEQIWQNLPFGLIHKVWAFYYHLLKMVQKL